ncbi:probable beta-1,4-xylosyltransferase IRX14 isoform X2 [Typha angustifolia]|uniref:probable beta-1,4-xylosyltransferase IRX14 isoform X2 n=1 Tax=Typha angustifolia TaxID=59011 RepID=UPI003C2F2F74
MKPAPPLHHPTRRAAADPSSSSAAAPAVSADSSAVHKPSSSASAFFLLLFHLLSCLLSLFLGFRFSHLLLLSSSPPIPLLSPPPPSPPPPPPPHLPSQHVTAGRHGILVRPHPHPSPVETSRAYRILAAVQSEQRRLFKNQPAHQRPLLIITPTYSRTFQSFHLSSLAHSLLLLLPSPLTWLVVSPADSSNHTIALLARFPSLPVLHLPFPGKIPPTWLARRRAESRMRLHALRVIRERRLHGVVVFADDSNVHSLEFFDEAKKVNWMGAVSLAILGHESAEIPIQGPVCNTSGHLVGWHSFNSINYRGRTATFIGEQGVVLPGKMEWAGFAMDARLVWREAEGRPDWVRDLDEVGLSKEEIESPLDLLKDAAFVEPLGSCGKKVMLWWLRVEARYDSKFPAGLFFCMQMENRSSRDYCSCKKNSMA